MKTLALLMLLWFLPNLLVWAGQGVFFVIELAGKIPPVRFAMMFLLGIIIAPFMLFWLLAKHISFQIFRFFLHLLIWIR